MTSRSPRQPSGTSRIRKSAERLLERLAHGAVAHAGAEADVLIAADLAVRRPDGTLAISGAGTAHLARRACARTGTVDPFLGQHLDIVRADLRTAHGRAAVLVDASESPLAWLARRKTPDGRPLIEPCQLQAGERLRSDFTLAQLHPRITANWTAPVAQDRRAADTAWIADSVVAARQRVARALDALGPEFSGLLLDVCCFLKGLTDVERERGWPSRCAKVVLQLGLDRLARHYGYGREACGAPHPPIGVWRAPCPDPPAE